MFVQVVSGQVGDVEALRRSLDRWMQELAPGADGWLGTTAGVGDDGRFVAVARFESAEAAARNSGRPEQDAWWRETSQALSGEATFTDSTDVTTWLGGGSDSAGFVQLMEGRTTDVEATRAMMADIERQLRERRPDVIGGVLALHGGDRFTQVVYFTTEAEAREGERRDQPDPGDMAPLTDLSYLDLRDPWFFSPPPGRGE
jgi:hypothetical protein